jgi:N-acetylglucosamine kinase-like BadF-type ATPase
VLLAGFDAGQTHTRCLLAWAPAPAKDAAAVSEELAPSVRGRSLPASSPEDPARQPGPGPDQPRPEGSPQAASGLSEPAPGEPFQLLAEGEGPGVSHLAAAGGPERFQLALATSLAAARQQLPSAWRHQPLAAAAIGASGIEAGSPVQRQGQALVAEALSLPPERLLVTGDERTALRGACGKGAGILVISGTGCIALGQDGQGRDHRCGGWGWLLDGAGSAMDLGRDGLALAMQMADGRLAETALRSQLWQALGVQSAQEVKALVVAPEFGPAGFARLAPVLNQLAAAGDPQARAVIETSAQALAGLVVGVARALELVAPRVCGVGGALTHLDQLRHRFGACLARELPAGVLIEPQGDACWGALELAHGLAGEAGAQEPLASEPAG